MPTPSPPLLSGAAGAHPGQGQVPLGCDTGPAPAPPSDRGCCAPASPFGIFPPSLCTGSRPSPSPVLRCSPPASPACSPGSACSWWRAGDPRPDPNTSGSTQGAPRRAPRPRCSWHLYGCTEPSCISRWGLRFSSCSPLPSCSYQVRANQRRPGFPAHDATSESVKKMANSWGRCRRAAGQPCRPAHGCGMAAGRDAAAPGGDSQAR